MFSHFFLQTVSIFCFLKYFFVECVPFFAVFFPLLKEKEFVLECVDCFFQLFFLICLAFF